MFLWLVVFVLNRQIVGLRWAATFAISHEQRRPGRSNDGLYRSEKIEASTLYSNIIIAYLFGVLHRSEDGFAGGVDPSEALGLGEART